MKIKKSATKAVKACDDVLVVDDNPAIDEVVIVDDSCVEPECNPSMEIDYVRDTVKELVDYLSQFDNELAKATVGNLAYIYLDLTEAVK